MKRTVLESNNIFLTSNNVGSMLVVKGVYSCLPVDAFFEDDSFRIPDRSCARPHLCFGEMIIASEWQCHCHCICQWQPAASTTNRGCLYHQALWESLFRSIAKEHNGMGFRVFIIVQLAIDRMFTQHRQIYISQAP